MTIPAADRVKAVWTGTGNTSPITLGAAVSGEAVQAFPSSLDGQAVGYLIKHESAAEAEAGIGVYTHSGTTLTRHYVRYPTPGGSRVTFSGGGDKHVSITPLAQFLRPNISASAPTVNDDIDLGYIEGMTWIDTSGPAVYMLTDSAADNAEWTLLSGGGGIAAGDIISNILAGARTITATDTLAAGDRGGAVICNNSSGITLTIPDLGLADACASVAVMLIGTAAVTINAPAVTLLNSQSSLPAPATNQASLYLFTWLEDTAVVVITGPPGGGRLSPYANATGDQTNAASGQSWLIVGNLTEVPVANGWEGEFLNISGSSKTLAPTSGSSCIVVEAGSTASSVTIANNKGVVVRGNGTDLVVYGDVV